jgi:pyruvate/2-oxoglutarate dehydrogenase complex dihydrolipoamide acyltransferase (E2) component
VGQLGQTATGLTGGLLGGGQQGGGEQGGGQQGDLLGGLLGGGGQGGGEQGAGQALDPQQLEALVQQTGGQLDPQQLQALLQQGGGQQDGGDGDDADGVGPDTGPGQVAKLAAKAMAQELGAAASDEVKDLGSAAARKARELGERRRQRRADKHNATPAALKAAQEEGIDLDDVEGTGADGRITVKDVREAVEA